MAKRKPLPRAFVKRLKAIRNKRARIVVEHIRKHEFVTTEDLEERYGYSHPPRAARDVREEGIPLETFRVKSRDGRTIAAYRFGDLSQIESGKIGGRKAFPKKFKEALYAKSDGKCAVCSGVFESRYLQVDHRVPYQVAGDLQTPKDNSDEYMLVCGSCNRAKSWSCEHCANWSVQKLPKICSACYWASPENYSHIALREIRRMDILWEEGEVQAYERLKRAAQENAIPLPDYVKKVVDKFLDTAG